MSYANICFVICTLFFLELLDNTNYTRQNHYLSSLNKISTFVEEKLSLIYYSQYFSAGADGNYLRVYTHTYIHMYVDIPGKKYQNYL